jgi:hypothetical protein
MPPDPFTQALISTLAYFDLWQHPLKGGELRAFLIGLPVGREEFDAGVAQAVGHQMIGHAEGHYFLPHRTAAIVARRRRREVHARRLWLAARLSTQVIKRCPFVRGVAVSGDLSKNSTDGTSDVDFFILTAPGRVWIVRAMLTLFKKTALFNRKKFFCLNSFCSTDHLEVRERSLYQAVEIATLKPVFNKPLLRAHLEANGWISDYFPNLVPGLSSQPRGGDRTSLVQKIQELLLAPFPLDPLDERLRRWMDRFWERRYPQFDRATRNRIFRSTREESRAYVGDFEAKILAEYARNLARHGVGSLSAREDLPLG